MRAGYGCRIVWKLAEERSGRGARRNVSSKKGEGNGRIVLFHHRVTAVRQGQELLGDDQQMREQGFTSLRSVASFSSAKLSS